MPRLPAKEWRRVLKRMPSLVADAVLIEGGKVLLIRRADNPWKGMWALPGGFVENRERVARACERELFEETGLRGKAVKLIGVYDGPKRDPRGHVVSLAFLVQRKSGHLRASSETSDVKFFPLGKLPKVISDHGKMITDALKLQSSQA